jgi:glutamine amidotransferase
MIAIVDYGMGNLRSVQKGFQKVGVDAAITSDPGVIDNAHAIVLPGVGAFRECMRNLSDLSLTKAVIRSIKKGKPYLGICLGLQVLFSEAEEFGNCKGLDIFKGKVVRFKFDGFTGKIPHMGWNNIKIIHRPPVLSDIPDNSTSMVWKDNVLATQFHPEKSQELGLKIMTGFGEFARRA